MSKIIRSEVVKLCAQEACDTWHVHSGRPVSGKIFYRILAALESAMPAHFSVKKIKDDGLKQLEFEDLGEVAGDVAPQKFKDDDVLIDSAPNATEPTGGLDWEDL